MAHSAKPVQPMIMVVPKSGSATARAVNTPKMATTGMVPLKNFSMRQPAQSRKVATESTAVIFPSSLGWRRTDPNRRSQRCDPFVFAENRTATIRPTTIR